MRAVFLTSLLLLGACGGEQQPRERTSPSGKYYGGVFNCNETDPIRSLFPLSLTQAAAHRVGAQVFEGLVSLDQQDLSVKPALAESWEVDAAGTTYSFHLRQGVLFHDDPCFADGKGRPMSASDVVRCYTALCTNAPWNQMFWLFQDRVVGANACFQGEASDVKGITAPDERTVRIMLTHPSPGFLQILAHQGCWIFPMEALEHYGEEVRWHPVGTGPFRVKSYERDVVMVLERNAAYWGRDDDGAELPYLDALRYTFESDKNKELDAFEDGRLSLIYELPVERIEVTRDPRFVMQTMPSLSIQFLGLNQRLAPFDDVRVRHAFDLAIDKRFIVDSVLGGMAVVADRGVVPPGLEGYPYDSLRVWKHDPARARELLKEAGYRDGQELPSVVLQVNGSGPAYVAVAEAVQSMLEQGINARVVVSVLPEAQHFARVEAGRAQLWREGWIADHPDPENFLALFYGRNAPVDTAQPSYLNSTRHRDPRFDSLFAQAVRTADLTQRMNLLAKAERVLQENGVAIPLYHERAVRLLQPWVQDMPINGMEYRDLRRVWIDPRKR